MLFRSSDTARLFILFAAPPDRDLDWSDTGVEGSFKFLNRVWRLVLETIENSEPGEKTDEELKAAVKSKDDKSLFFEMNKTIKRITDSFDGGKFGFNTAISSIMELVNEMYRYKQQTESVDYALLRGVADRLVLVLSPFVPHIAEELWQRLGHETAICKEEWPSFDPSALVLDTVEIVVQLNGKVKMKADVPSNLSKEELSEMMLEDAAVKELVADKNIVKVIAVPGKLVNIVIK